MIRSLQVIDIFLLDFFPFSFQTDKLSSELIMQLV